MASAGHQLILGLVARRMRQKGYEIVSFDGSEALIGTTHFKVPPIIRRHRPDAIGVNLQNRRICIGEAKTSKDLHSSRTKEQFADYSSLFIRNNEQLCELVIGIPRSSESKLKQMLETLGIANNPNVSYVWMPDEFLRENDHDI